MLHASACSWPLFGDSLSISDRRMRNGEVEVTVWMGVRLSRCRCHDLRILSLAQGKHYWKVTRVLSQSYLCGVPAESPELSTKDDDGF